MFRDKVTSCLQLTLKYSRININIHTFTYTCTCLHVFVCACVYSSTILTPDAIVCTHIYTLANKTFPFSLP